MLKTVFFAISVSLLAVACGGGQADPATADDAAKKDAPADAPKTDEAKPAEPPDTAAPADAAKPAEAAPK
jgi:hypothetical protein